MKRIRLSQALVIVLTLSTSLAMPAAPMGLTPERFSWK